MSIRPNTRGKKDKIPERTKRVGASCSVDLERELAMSAH